MKKKLSSNGVKKPVLDVAKQPKPLMEVQQQQLKRNHRAELETHLGIPVPYKIATMGSARRLAYMASVVVEGEQYKTYPQTFPSQVIQDDQIGLRRRILKFIFPSQAEAEEALAALVLDKRGVETGQVCQSVSSSSNNVFIIFIFVVTTNVIIIIIIFVISRWASQLIQE